MKAGRQAEGRKEGGGRVGRKEGRRNWMLGQMDKQMMP